MKKTNLCTLFGLTFFSIVLVFGTVMAVKASQNHATNQLEIQTTTNKNGIGRDRIYTGGDEAFQYSPEIKTHNINKQDVPNSASKDGIKVKESEEIHIPLNGQKKNFDIYIKDNPDDDGSVPSSEPWWGSPDIWARNDGDCTNVVQQNPGTDSDTTICIRVRNRALSPVNNIKVKLYYSMAGLGLIWPGTFYEIGSAQIPTLAPMTSVVKAIPWHTPNLFGHYCLLARADSNEDPLDSGFDTVVPTDEVPNNNNIAERNVTILDDFPEIFDCNEMTDTVYTQTVHFFVLNSEMSEVTVDLRFNSTDFPLGGGEIQVDPSTLWNRWNSLSKFKKAGLKLELTDFPAVIEGVGLDAQEFVPFYMDISAPGNVRFEISVSELEKDKVQGGNNYIRLLPNCTFLPMAFNK